MSFLDRTLASIQRGEVITPFIEEALVKADWPEEYPVKMYNKERKWDGYFHPSSDPLAGEYQLYYKFSEEWQHLFVQERPTPSLEMTFQVGSAVHSIIQSMLIHLGFVKLEDVEVKFINEDHWISGATDIRRLTLPNGREFIVDIKSAGFIPKEPSLQYKVQIMLYQDNVPDAPDEMALLYIGKASPHEIKDFVIEKDQIELDRVYSKWDRVRVAVGKQSPSDLKPCCNGPDTQAFLVCPAKSFCVLWNK